MPENPDITVYIERLEEFVSGQPLEQIRFASHIFLRSAEPPIKSIHGAVVHGVNRYATNDTNYCPQCQTGGKLLAERAMSRRLEKDWPCSLEELETGRQNISWHLADKIREKE